ncbi:MAG: crossover junction endodeoxyribonuclease RuvC [bacterium]
MKSIKSKIILAINPGARYLGVAVFENGQPQFWQVKSIKMNQPPRERISDAKEIVQKLIDYYEPGILAIQKPKPHWLKQSRLLDKIIKAIKDTARDNKMKVKEFMQEEIRKAICGNIKATKKEMAEVLRQKFPKLRVLLDLNKIKDRYWEHLVGAMILADVAKFELRGNILLNQNKISELVKL